MLTGELTRKDFEGSGCGIILRLCWHSPGGTEENRDKNPARIVQEAGWTPEPIWTQRLEEKSFAPAEDRASIARSSSP
jgi:hypothetical protein